jgi:CheY-like chemotaxis protein
VPGPERNVPIVALTGNALVAQRESCLAGVNAYLSKPFEPADLYAAIYRCGTVSSKLLKKANSARSSDPCSGEASIDSLCIA